MALTITAGGEPLESQQLTAGPVELVAVTSYRVTALSVYVDAAPVSVTWTCTQDGRLWRTTATVDLTDVVGPVDMAVQVVTRGTTRQSYPVTVEPAHPWVRTADTGPRIPRAEMTDHPGGNLSKAGQVIEGLRFTGQVLIRARDVTLRDCLFDYPMRSGKMLAAATGGLLLDHCELNGHGDAELGIGGAQFTATHCNIHHLLDGFRIASGVVIENTWVHHLVRPPRDPKAHGDCVQMTVGTGSTIRRNVFEAANPDTGDLNNSAVMIGGETGRTQQLTIEDNLMGGGNYTVQTGWGDIDHATIVLRRNVYTGGWRYGPIKVNRAVSVTGETLTDGTPAKVSRW